MIVLPDTKDRKMQRGKTLNGPGVRGTVESVR